jgi:putative RecB family exonuclease
MTLPLPATLSPSKVASFKDCALAFRFSAIDRVPEPASPWAAKGTLVHRALELLFWEVPAGERTVEAALAGLQQAWAECQVDPEYTELALTEEEAEAFRADAEALVRSYFRLEDPNRVRVVGTELRLEAQVGSLRLRGIIDRLELDDDGELVVTDYKTGRAPGQKYEQGRLGGVQFYAFLCEQVFGRRPARVQLLHLREPVAIVSTPTEQSLRGLQTRASAVWSAIELACRRDDFRPRPGPLCNFCAFKAYCPAFGGDPALVRAETAAAVEAPVPLAV